VIYWLLVKLSAYLLLGIMKIKAVPVHAMKRIEEERYSATLSQSRHCIHVRGQHHSPVALPRKNYHEVHWIGRWQCPKGDLDILENRNCLFPSKNGTPDGHVRSPDARTRRSLYKKQDRHNKSTHRELRSVSGWAPLTVVCVCVAVQLNILLTK
jgi:hypothetical protein